MTVPCNHVRKPTITPMNGNPVQHLDTHLKTGVYLFFLYKNTLFVLNLLKNQGIIDTNRKRGHPVFLHIN